MNSRYIVLRKADVLDFLTAEERNTLAAFIAKIEVEREARKKDPYSTFFCLNVRDEFAQPALEAYIKSARDDRRSQELDGIKLAIKAAQDARMAGIMMGTKKAPSVPRK